ncbi:hypothetical protein QTV49_000478 [Vibrio vulnificus]|nr:hypothetical protein [Vibrio vulnificus]
MNTAIPNIQPINTILTLGTNKPEQTKVIWVTITDSVGSESHIWFYDEYAKDAIEAHERDKTSAPCDIQSLLFTLEVDATLSVDEVTEYLDEYYCEYGHSLSFLNNQNVLSFPYSPQDWFIKVASHNNEDDTCNGMYVTVKNPDEASLLMKTLKSKGVDSHTTATSNSSEVRVWWNTPKPTLLEMVSFTDLPDKGIILNGEVIQYTEDYPAYTLEYTLMKLESALGVQHSHVCINRPDTEEWNDWDWNLVANSLNNPELKALLV